MRSDRSRDYAGERDSFKKENGRPTRRGVGRPLNSYNISRSTGMAYPCFWPNLGRSTRTPPLERHSLRAVSKLDKEGHRTKGALFRLRFESRNKLTST